MKLVFVSNYMNHHQLPISLNLYERCQKEGGEYVFIQTEPMEEERVNMGWGKDLLLPSFVQNYWENPEACKRIIQEADAVIFGGCEEEAYLQERLSKGKVVWRYSESVYKEGRWRFVSPRGLIKKYKDHTRYRKNRVYLLCSGAYVAGDFRLFLAYPDKKFRYGYFPIFKKYNIDSLLQNKQEKLTLLWAARMIYWKHPEVPIRLAAQLKQRGYEFVLIMVGDGEMMPRVKKWIQEYHVEDCVELKGFCSPKETREYMEKSHIYLATSDRREGWGAVINEAMNSGMVVVANRGMGAAPYLIQNGVNGILYQSSHTKNLWKQLVPYLENPQKRREMAKKAYATIAECWNEEVAARRLYDCIAAEWKGEQLPVYEAGPLCKEK